MKVTRTYPNGFVRELTVLSFDDQGDDSGIVETVESGSVAVSKKDTPEIWQQLTEKWFG